MRILFIFFIFCFIIKGNECKCSVNTLNFDPYCGFDKDCNYHGANKKDVDNESCRRKAQKVANFVKVTKGKCPGKKTICIPTPDL